MMRSAFAFLVLFTSASASAQDFSFRPFAMFAEQRFAAEKTFDATFGQNEQPFLGGGVSITQDDRYYLDVSASRFKKTGVRAYYFNGQSFNLGIAQRVTITPVEFVGGYRFHPAPRIIPTVGGGIGFYNYKQVSDFSTDEENVDTSHSGAIVEGGVEIRLYQWIGVAVDVHYSYVPGILGDDGFSKDAGEKNLGGIAARFRVVVGK
jgi:outer membrane protein W